MGNRTNITLGDLLRMPREEADAIVSGLVKAVEGSIGALEFSRDFHSDGSNADQAFAQDRLDDATSALAAVRGQK